MSARLSPRRRRVLLTADAVGGVWAYALDLARGLIRAGCEVHLLVLGPAPDVDQMAQARACPGLRLKAPALPLEWMATSAEAIDDASRALAGLVRDIDPDIVHLSNPALACSGEIEAPLVAVLHSCMATWWTTLRPATPMPADLHQRCDRIRRGLATAEAVIAPSRSFAALARATYPAVDPFVVRNGRAAPPAATGNAERSGVFAAGRLWDEAKGAAVLDAAAARLDRKITAAGPLRTPGAPASGSIELPHLHLLGAIGPEEVRRRLARSAVYVSAARYEPFGLGVLEAAQAGCALVLSDIPTHRELWNGAASFFPPDDAAALAATITSLDRHDQREALATAARMRAARYDVGSMIAGTAALHDWVLAYHARRGAA